MAELGALTVAVRLAVDGIDAGVEQVQESLKGLEASAGGVDNAMKQASGSIEEGSARQVIALATVAAAAAKAFSMIKASVADGVRAYNEYTSAVKGLESIASHNNIGQAELSKGLEQLTDNFFNVQEASLSLKNLLSRGYSMDEAVATITRLKDAAAFGRQASLSFGEAVVSATEGIKNENSILVNEEIQLPNYTVRLVA